SGLIGCFAQYLILRTSIAPAEAFRTLVARVRDTIRDADGHQNVEFVRIVQAVQRERAAEPFNPTQVVFNLLSSDQMYPVLHSSGLQTSIGDDGPLGSVGFGFEIAIQVYDWEQSLRAVVGYDSTRSDAGFIRGFLDSYVTALQQAARDPTSE